MLHIEDCLNNQFMLFDYLANINDTIVQYLENNNYLINYYCTYYKNLTSKHQLITSNTIKKKDNGYRFITIDILSTSIDTPMVTKFSNFIVYYENLIITVSECYNQQDMIKNNVTIGENSNHIKNDNKISCYFRYSKDINENNVKEITLHYDTYKVQMFKNLIKAATTYQLLASGMNFPENLQSLKLIKMDYQLIELNAIPHNLHTLELNHLGKYTIPESVLPPNLRILIIGYSYKGVLQPNVLPASLQVLMLDADYKLLINPDVLPTSLQIICFTSFNILNKYNKVVPTNYTGEIYYINDGANLVYESDKVTLCHNENVHNLLLKNPLRIF
jgi:hypothetical protein